VVSTVVAISALVASGFRSAVSRTADSVALNDAESIGVLSGDDAVSVGALSSPCAASVSRTSGTRWPVASAMPAILNSGFSRATRRISCSDPDSEALSVESLTGIPSVVIPP
jgi:hypothetical protein